MRCLLISLLLISLEDIFAGFALKLILNAISTGANVLKGRVYGNRMINLTVANDKVCVCVCACVCVWMCVCGCGEEEGEWSLVFC